METLRRENADGPCKDLPPVATTMWESQHLCACTEPSQLSESSRRIYCYKCGIWWLKRGA